MSNNLEQPGYQKTPTEVPTPEAHEIRSAVYGGEVKKPASRGKQMGIIGAALAGLIAVGGGGAVIASNMAENKTPGTEAPTVPGENPTTPDDILPTTSTPEVTPTPEVSPTDIPTDTETEQGWSADRDIITRPEMPESLKKYEEMTPEEFIELPKAEQLTYASWLTSYRNDFIDTFSYLLPLPVNMPFTVSKDSSALELMSEVAYTKRMAAYMTEDKAVPVEDGSCGVQDQDALAKTILAHTDVQSYFDRGSGYSVAGNIEEYSQGRGICPSAQALLDYFPVDEIKITNEERSTTEYWGIKDATTVDIEYTQQTEEGAKDYAITLHIVPTTNYKGDNIYSVLSQAPYVPEK